jgi:hypothetical protein
MSSKRLTLIALAVASALAASPLFLDPGFLNTRGGGDSPFLLFRLHQLYSAVTQGVFPVRWMPDAAFGLGYPFFNYYAALPLYVAALFKLFGASYVLALKLTHLGGFLLAGFAMYGWMRATQLDRPAAWLAAVAYSFAPFHLVNVYVRGDSLGEFWAFAFYPLCLWAARRLAGVDMREAETQGADTQVRPYKYALLLALAYAGLILTHNISALIFSPFLGLYLLVLVIAPPNTQYSISNTQSLPASGPFLFIVHCSLSIVLGLALSAFYWFPALRETDFAQLGAQTTGYFHYSNHFRGLDLVQTSPVFDFDVGGPASTPFAMGLAQFVILLVAFLLIALHWRRNLQSPISNLQLLFYVSGFVISTLMITPLSQPLWANLPLLPFVQFPWRFLSVQSLFVSALIGIAGQGTIHNSKFTTPLVSVLCIVNCALSIAGLRPDFVPLADADVTPRRLQTYEYFTGNIGTTIRYEYLPKWTQPRPYSSEEFIFGTASLKPLDGEAAGERLDKRAASQRWRVTVDSASAKVAVPLLYWPGWEAHADGESLKVEPAEGLGWIAFELPKGEHVVELKLGDTDARRNATWVSILAWLLLLLTRPWKLLQRPERRATGGFLSHVVEGRALLRLGVAALALIVCAVGGRLLNANIQPTGAATMDFDQLGYLHSTPVTFGNFDVLQNYNYSAETLRPGDTLAVSMLWQGKGDAAFNLDLVSPAEHLLSLPRDIAHATVKAGGLTVAALRLPDDLPSGVYLLRLNLTQGDLFAPALTSGGRPRGTLYLRPIIVGAAFSRDDLLATQPATQLTPSIGLVNVTAIQTDSSAIMLTLNWLATAPVPANYILALRLNDSIGAELAALDAQPTGGVYPTSAWRVGEALADQYRIKLPHGLIPGNYPLTITLYEASTLAPAGTTTLPIAITQWSPPPAAKPLHQFADRLALYDLALPQSLKVGETLTFTARWTVIGPAQDLQIRWRVTGKKSGVAVAVNDLPLSAALPSSQWAAGALVAGQPSFPIPVTAEPGEYELSGELLDASGGSLSQPIPLGNLLLLPSDRTALVPPMQFEADGVFGPIKLLGYDVALTPNSLTLTLHWQASGPADKNYKTFVHVFNPDDEAIAAQADEFPAVPTTQWFKDEVVNQTLTLPLTGLAPGTLYNIGVGWYDPATGDRLGERVILSQGVVKP